MSKYKGQSQDIRSKGGPCLGHSRKGNNMAPQKLVADYDPLVLITDFSMLENLGDTAFLGNWFVFLKAEWLKRSGMARLLEPSSVVEAFARPTIVFRGKEEITLPAARIAPTPLPGVNLVSLTCDKALYRANRDTVRLLIAVPQQPQAELKLKLRLSGNPYADYPLTLDEFGLCLWSMQGLPEGEYEATLEGVEADVCRFEVAEYRLAPLNAELSEQQLSGETLRYVLSVTAFGQPYNGPIEVELQERGQRIGKREQLSCNREGQCHGVVKLTGKGPYTLSVFAGERTATVALKGSEQERRETMVISELGEVRELSLLPLPQSNQCRGMYIAQGGVNTEPFLVRRVIGSEVEITPRVDAELLRVVVVDPVRKTFEEKLYSNLQADQGIRRPIPTPYGIVLLGAFVDGKAWEGWCAVLRPSDIQLQCEAPKEAKPGARVTVTLKTGISDRVVPVQLIVKDQRLIAPSDPQVEFAACIKKNLGSWREQSGTGEIDRQMAHLTRNRWYEEGTRGFGGPRPMAAFATGAFPGTPPPMMAVPMAAPVMQSQSAPSRVRRPARANGDAAYQKMDAVQPVYGELTVSPFVFPGDPVMGRLDVGAASGGAIVEVRHDGEALPLFFDNGDAVTPGLPVPSGSVLRFPVRPGAITSTVRDARKGGIDVSERYVTEPGKLRHIMRRLHLLTPGDEVTLQEQHRLEIKPVPGLEKPFQFFVEGAAKYPFG